MEALDAAETAFHQVGKQIVAVKLAGMREHRQPAVLHDDPHGVARVHVVDVAVADAAVLEQAAIQRAVGGAGVRLAGERGHEVLLVQARGRAAQLKRALYVHFVARFHQPVQLPQRVRVTALKRGPAQGGQRGRALLDAQPQDVHLAAALEVVGAHLDAAHHLHAQALAQLASGGQPGSGVVVRERQALDASLRRLFEHLLERVRSVGHRRMHVKIFDHDSPFAVRNTARNGKKASNSEGVPAS